MFSLLIRIFSRRRRPDVAQPGYLRMHRGGLKQRWSRGTDGALEAHWVKKTLG